MKRVAVLSFYDSEGIVYDYLFYYIDQLLKVVDSIYFISNGKINEYSLRELKKRKIYIYERENIGFDAACYKFFFDNIYNDKLCDELIFTNDTVFGPMVPFLEIFDTMGSRQCDFWGVDYYDNGLYQFLMSNFLVFKKRIFESLRKYFLDNVTYDAPDKHSVCMQFERGLFKFLVDKNCRWSSYTKQNSIDPYASPDTLLWDYDCPFVKKRAYEINYDKYRNNLLNVISVIRRKYAYDIGFIKKFCLKKYKIDFPEYCGNFVDCKPVCYECFRVSAQTMIQFSKSNTCCYIYGTGYLAQDIAVYYKNDIKNFAGFVVSDDYYEVGSLLGCKVYKFSEIELDSACVIVVLSKKNSDEIKKKIGVSERFLFLR